MEDGTRIYITTTGNCYETMPTVGDGGYGGGGGGGPYSGTGDSGNGSNGSNGGWGGSRRQSAAILRAVPADSAVMLYRQYNPHD